jgi:uncharacterized protein (DUF1778 family)
MSEQWSTIAVRFTREEFDQIAAAADAAGQTVVEFASQLLVGATKPVSVRLTNARGGKTNARRGPTRG